MEVAKFADIEGMFTTRLVCCILAYNLMDAFLPKSSGCKYWAWKSSSKYRRGPWTIY